MLNDNKWKRQDKSYHEDPAIVESFDRVTTRKYRLEHKYFTLNKWIEELKSNKAELVLDFGCGTGTASLYLLRNGFRAVSIDASLKMVQKLKEKSRKESLSVSCLVGDVEQLSFKDEIFDGIVCMGVLHHIPNILKGLEEQTRVLKKGGVIFIAEPYQHKPWISYPYEFLKNFVKFILGIFKKRKLTTPERLLTVTHLKQIKDFLEKHNLEYQVEYFVYWPVICGYLPETITLPLVNFINGLNRFSQRGDGLIIKVKKYG